MSTQQTAPALLDPDYASPEWQEWCAQHFIALEPGAGAAVDIDLDELEVAQEQYREVRLMLDATLPYEEWLKWRPSYVGVKQHGAWLEALGSLIQELQESYGVALLTAGPAIATQRQRPH